MPDISIDSTARTLSSVRTTDLGRASGEVDKAVAPKEVALEAPEETREETESRPPPEESARAAAERLQSYANRLNRSLEFSVDDPSGRTVVTVRDSNTEEVIRQIPSEEALRLAKEIDHGGVRLFDSHA